MASKLRDISLVEAIIKYCKSILSQVDTVCNNDFSNFESDIYTVESVAFKLVQIGECVAKLSNEFKSRYNQIPWIQIKDMRNFIVHAYDGFDMDEAWETILHDLPDLLSECENISNDLNA
jgi:uncharacterized protein with HEPN domain